MGFRPASTLILVRPASRGPEVLLLHRAPALRFLGNFWVFPGGSVDRGESPEAAAVRETFEETGLLLVPGAEALAASELRARREEVLADPKRFAPTVEALGLAADWSRVVPCGRWVTPPFGPVRFDTTFFLALAPAAGAPSVAPGEIDALEWLAPQAMLERWTRDEALLAPPTRVTLEALAGAEGDPREPGWLGQAAARIAAAHPEEGEWQGAIDFRPGLRLFLVRTPTLPPATHTNCMIVGDGSEAVVIDPASPYPEERAKLDALLDGLAAAGTRVREVVLTHHHHDHCSGAQHLADRLGVPIAAHARTQERARDLARVTRLIEDGEVIDLPADRPGARPRRLRAHLLEGHADGHLAFHEEVTNSVIAGDMVAGVGTIVVDPPEGDMARYLESLRRLRALGGELLYPSHGPPIGDPAGVLDFYVAHRLEREAKIVAALEPGPADLEAIVPRAYDDKPAQVFPLAKRAALAHLIKLEAEGKVERRASDGAETWSLRPT